MTVAAGSSTTATYVASASSAPSTIAAGSSTQVTTSSAPAAAPLPGGTPALSDSTVAALVAQQAADTAERADGAPSVSLVPSPGPPAQADPDQVQIPPAVLANMKAFETTSPTAYTDQVSQYAGTINDAKASDQDRLSAWTTLSGMLSSGTIYKAGNVADLQTALDATQTSAYARSLMQLQNQFQAANVSNADADRAKGVYGPQPLLDTLNSYSQADQQKIFVLMGLNQSYSDLDSMKADYQQVADIYASTGVLTKGTRQIAANPPSAASSADPAIAAPSQVATPASQPAATSTSATDQGVAVALKTMQSISDQMAAARKGATDGGILSLFKGASSQADGAGGSASALGA